MGVRQENSKWLAEIKFNYKVIRLGLFDTPEEAAIFLLRNPDWKIWVAGNGTHSDGQVKNGLVIDGTFDFDDLKRRGFL